MKATLRYSDCLQDDRKVFRILAENNIDIVKIKIQEWSLVVYITIFVDSRQKLNELLYKLNCECPFEVSVVKISGARIKNKMSKSDIEGVGDYK